MNKVILMGRLTRDPEVRVSQGERQTTIGRFSIAVDRRFKREGQPDTDFFNCTAFGRQAEFIEKYLHKGTKVVVVGSIQNDNYTNKDGVQQYSVQIMVDEIEFAESKSAQSESGFNGGFQSQSQPAANNNAGDFMNVPDGIVEELPFT